MSRFINPIPQFLKSDGDLVAGGTLTFYESNTSTLLRIFNDPAESISLPNPVELGDRGEVPNIFFSGSARVVLNDAFGVQIFDVDPVSADSVQGQFSTWEPNTTYDANSLVFGSDELPYISLTSSNQGNDPTVSPSNNANWSQLQQIKTWNAREIYELDNLVIENGTIFKSVTNNNTNQRPSTDNGSNWQAVTAANGLTFDNTTSGLPATTVQEALDQINAAVNSASRAISYGGALDLTAGDAGLPVTPPGGTAYAVSTGGTITVSTDGGAPAATLVEAGSTIVYNADLARWELLPSNQNAVQVVYDNLTSGVAATNVQAALDNAFAQIQALSLALQIVIDNASATVGGLVYRGQLNVSGGDPSLPLNPQAGDFYQISVGGDITVSTDGSVPAITTVNARDQIIWNALLGRWDRSVAPEIAVSSDVELSKILTQPLALVPITGTARWYPANDIDLIGIRASVGVPSVGADILIELRKNGLVVASATIPEGQNTSGVIEPASVDAVIGDFFTLDITQVGSGTPGSDLTFVIEYKNA